MLVPCASRDCEGPLAGPLALRLLNDFQRHFPLHPEPFALIGAELGVSEAEVLSAYRRHLADGTVSRIGAVLAPRRIGASALAALSAPADRLDDIAARVSAVAEVNHNYEREHRFNLWFVVTAASPRRLAEIVAGIEADTGCPVIQLPLEEEYHIDLGFDLTGRAAGAPARPRFAPPSPAGAYLLSAAERRLMGALQDGLAIEPRPYAALGRRAGMAETEALALIRRWLGDGLIKRFGVVVRHRELGFGANAMCVWDVPDEWVAAVGQRLAADPAVTLCYRRRRMLPYWQYNLFCMIHGRAREAVRAARDAVAAHLGLDAWPHAVLFSRRRFKQTGARYLPGEEAVCHG